MDAFAWIVLSVLLGIVIFLFSSALIKIARELGKSDQKNEQYRGVVDVQKKYGAIDSDPSRSARDILKLMRKRDNPDMS